MKNIWKTEKSDMSYVLMELTKVTERVDALENQSPDDNEETKSVGAVNIEFTGETIRRWPIKSSSEKMSFHNHF